MKLRVAFLSLREPADWTLDEGKSTERKGQTFKVSVMVEESGDPVTLKVSKDFHEAVRQNGLTFGNVLDVVFVPRVVLDVNRNGRPEQVLKIVPDRYEWVGKSFEDIAPKPEKKAS